MYLKQFFLNIHNKYTFFINNKLSEYHYLKIVLLMKVPQLYYFSPINFKEMYLPDINPFVIGTDERPFSRKNILFHP